MSKSEFNATPLDLRLGRQNFRLTHIPEKKRRRNFTLSDILIIPIPERLWDVAVTADGMLAISQYLLAGGLQTLPFFLDIAASFLKPPLTAENLASLERRLLMASGERVDARIFPDRLEVTARLLPIALPRSLAATGSTVRSSVLSPATPFEEDRAQDSRRANMRGKEASRESLAANGAKTAQSPTLADRRSQRPSSFPSQSQPARRALASSALPTKAAPKDRHTPSVARRDLSRSSESQLSRASDRSSVASP